MSKTSKSTTATGALNLAVSRQFELNTALLQGFAPSSEGPFPELVLLRSSEGYDAKGKGLECEKHEWLEERGDKKKAVEGWEKVTGKEVPVVDIPGNHFEVFDGGNVSFSFFLSLSASGIVYEEVSRLTLLCL